ncbi:MAG: hypothetical protein ABFD54_16780 [Armatimonadota bacterium]|nr:hypothetical protein [bacterium]
MEWYERGPDSLGGYTERDFKVCDLCGALNPVSNHECFVCGWSGQFRTDGESVRLAMEALESEYGSLDESIFEEEVVPSTPPRPTFWSDFWGNLKRLLIGRE